MVEDGWGILAALVAHGCVIFAAVAICVSLEGGRPHGAGMLERITFVRQFHHKNTFVMVVEVSKKYFAWLPKSSPYVPCEKDDSDSEVYGKVSAFMAANPGAAIA